MTTLATTFLTLMDVASRKDPNGQLADILELVTKDTPLLQDAPAMEGNRPDGTIHTARTAHGSSSWRRMNQGSNPSKSSTSQFADVVGFLDAWTKVDEKVAQQSGDPAKCVNDEEQDQMQGMREELESTVFYGNAGSVPEEFTGLAPRFAAYGSNVRTSHVFNAGGSGSDCTSIYLVGWGQRTAGLLYPKGSAAGLDRVSYGKIPTTDADGKPLVAYMSHYTWDIGLGLPDWRSVVRIANIDFSDLETAGTSADVSAALIELMIRALHLLPQGKAMRPVFYAHPDVVALLAVKQFTGAKTVTIGDYQAANGLVTPGTLQVLGHAVRGTEQISLAETALTA